MMHSIGKSDVWRRSPVAAFPAELAFNRTAGLLDWLRHVRGPGAILLGLLFLAGAARAGAAEHPLHGTVIYASTSPMADFSGTNAAVTGTAAWDKPAGTIKAEVLIDLAKWSSGSALREKHTLAMFEVDRFPKASFSLAGMASEPARTNVTLKGTLELHGVKQPLDIPGKLNMESDRVNFSGDFTLRLTEWGMKRPSLLGAQVDDVVKVHIQAEAATK
jgi:polyisoprenoid-binding protein YceI